MADNLVKLVALHEGRSRKPYYCTSGKLTIGVGHNLEDNGLPDKIIDMLFEYDINEVRIELLRRHPWYRDLCEVRRAVLEDMAFNMGVPRLGAFKNFLAAVKAGDWPAAEREMFDSRWAFQVGDGPGKREDRADRLAKMIRTGDWPDDI